MTEFGENLLFFFVSFGVSSVLLSTYAMCSIFPKRNDVFNLLYRINWVIMAMVHMTVQLMTLNGMASFINITMIGICGSTAIITFLKLQNHSYTKIFLLNLSFFLSSFILCLFAIYLATEYPSPMISKIIKYHVCTTGFLPAMCLSNLIFCVSLYKKRYDFIFKEIPRDNVQIIDGKEAIPLENLINKEDECAICLDELRTNVSVELACSHQFHRVCILTHFNNNLNCPICRHDFNVIIDV